MFKRGTRTVCLLSLIFISIFLISCESAKPYCLDGICQSNEDCSSCPVDCGKCPVINKTVPNDKTASPPYKIKEEIKSQYSCKPCKMDEKCISGQCTEIELTRKNVCGNFVCDDGEYYDGELIAPGKEAYAITNKRCFFDCSPKTRGVSNSYVDIVCACDEAADKNIASCAVKDTKEYGKCLNCGEEEKLFNHVAELQKEAIKCLSDYFSFRPPIIKYYLYHLRGKEICNFDGCTKESGAAANLFVYQSGLNGYIKKGNKYVTQLEDLRIDVHETIHIFMSLMLHHIPSWFNEAAAIQTNERLICPNIENHRFSKREAYLSEIDYSLGAGVLDVSGAYINLAYWKKLKENGVPLPKEIIDSHTKGTLFVLALRDEYGCGADCFRDIIIKLKEMEQQECMQGDGKNCQIKLSLDLNEEDNIVPYGLFASWVFDKDKRPFWRIKKVVEEVVGNDISWILFLLNIDEKTL